MPASAAATAGSASMKKSKPEPIPVMDYRQYRRARRLVHECCNYDGGNCIALDDGEECVCVQSISYSLLCRWFRAAVLPLDRELETALFHRLDAKRCVVCGALFTPGSNRAKYCPECAVQVRRRKEAERQREKIPSFYAFRGRKPLVNQGLFRGCRRGPDRFILWPPKRPSKGVQTPEINPKEEPMSDNRKYYYLKLKENYFDDDSIVLLESMQDGVLYSNILLKLYLKSLKHGGRLQLDENIPYTAQMIATITRQQIGTVERALQIFLKLGLVEVLDSGTFYMSNIELLIGQSSTEAERKRAARLQNKALSAPRTNGGHLSDIRPPEIEIELEKEIEIKREIEKGHPARAYGRYQNVFLTDEELADLQASFPTVWGQYIEKLSEYMASTGKRYQSHAATIRRWAGEDARKAAPPSRNRDYSVKEDETV